MHGWLVQVELQDTWILEVAQHLIVLQLGYIWVEDYTVGISTYILVSHLTVWVDYMIQNNCIIEWFLFNFSGCCIYCTCFIWVTALLKHTFFLISNVTRRVKTAYLL